MPTPVFYINLASRPDRRAFMEMQFSALGITAERTEAVTPAAIPPDLKSRFCDTQKLHWVSPEELGCTLSHRAIWQAVVDRGLLHALVLEDDMSLSSQLNNAVESAISQAGGLDVIKIETKFQEVLVGRPDQDLGAARLQSLYSFHFGTGAYIVSMAGAQKLLGATDYFDLFVDNLLFHPQSPIHSRLRVRQMVPGFAVSIERIDQNAPAAHSSLQETNALQPRRRHEREFVPPVRRFFIRSAREVARHTTLFLAVRLRGAKPMTVPFSDGSSARP